jgi:probable addiction module antidote protein
MTTLGYKSHLLKQLKDSEHAAGYLTAALEEGEDVFLLAVRDVVEAHGGMGSLADATKLNRENPYDMLSRNGNPRLSSITAILNSSDLKCVLRPRVERRRLLERARLFACMA